MAQTRQEVEGRMLGAPSKDVTLLRMEAGLAALREGDLAGSRSYFDSTLDAIESVFSDSEASAKARSLWYGEGSKDFKGEPYERALAYYYRGLIYMVDGDYGNARAAFRSALTQSGFADELTYESTFASLYFLLGWTNEVMGDAEPARQAYAEVRRLRPGWDMEPPASAKLVLIELGGAPRKVGDGIGLHEIVYRPAKRMPEKSAQIVVNGSVVSAYPMDDLFYQASHRGRRQIDRIIDGKVTFKEEAAGAGEGLAESSKFATTINVVVGGHAGGAIGAAAGIATIATLVSMNVNPAADVRYWNNLPETMHLVVLKPDDTVGDLVLRDESGAPVEVQNVARHEWTDPAGRKIVWIKVR
jgi:Tetratricopeptide repeat